MKEPRLGKAAAKRIRTVDGAARDAALPRRDTALVRAVALVAKLGDQPEMYAVAGSLAALGMMRGDRRMTRAGLRAAASLMLATRAKNVIKSHVDRRRPRDSAGAPPLPRLGEDHSKANTSFPSGHSAGAMATARALSRDYPELAPYLIATATLLALAQIPKCAHYPTDVGAGIAIGLAAEKAVDLVVGHGSDT